MTGFSFKDIGVAIVLATAGNQLMKAGAPETPVWIAGLAIFLVTKILLGTRDEVLWEQCQYRIWEHWLASHPSIKQYREQTNQSKGQLVCDACESTQQVMLGKGAALEGVTSHLWKWTHQQYWNYRSHLCNQCGKELWRSKEKQ